MATQSWVELLLPSWKKHMVTLPCTYRPPSSSSGGSYPSEEDERLAGTLQSLCHPVLPIWLLLRPCSSTLQCACCHLPFPLGTVGCWKAAATSDSSRKNWMWCSDIMIVCDIMTSFLDSTWVREKWKRKLTSHCSCSWNCIWRLWLAVGEVWQGGMTSLWSVAVKASWRANVCTSKYASSCLVLDTAPKSKGSVSMGLDWGHLHVCQGGFWHGRISYSN